MSDTKIEWADKVWNPTRGCSLVSPGCENCYAMKQAHRFSGPGQPYEGLTELGPNGPRWNGEVWYSSMADSFYAPYRWRKPVMVFVDSMSDLFHETVPFPFIDDVLDIIERTPHTYLILTKRVDQALRYFESTGNRIEQWRKCGRRIWLVVSVENQKTADERIPGLLRTPAAVRGVSYEPALGPVDFTRMIGNKGDRSWSALQNEGEEPTHWERSGAKVDWVICGGESGPRARPMQEEWARNVMLQCKEADVPFFMKQGSKANWPDFKNFESFPKDLQVREFPNAL